MKLTSSSIIAVLVLSCTAAFGQTTVSLGFLDHDKTTQYCDFEQLTVEKGSSVVTGTHFQSAPNSTTCPSQPGLDGQIAGLVANFPATSGLTVTGTVATFADDTEANAVGYMGRCGCSYYYVSKLRPSTPLEIQKNVFGWAVYENFGGTAGLVKFGFTTKQLGNNDANSADTYDIPLP